MLSPNLSHRLLKDNLANDETVLIRYAGEGSAVVLQNKESH